MKFVNFIMLLWILFIINCVIGEEILSISIPESYSPIGEKQDKVDPKLDLENSDEETNNSTPSSKYPKGGGNSGSGGGSGTSNTQGKPTSPKIQGVRVTVDTGPNGKGDSSGSKESVEILEPKKGKRVGIHTDITFEISDDSDTGNTTFTKNKDDDEVPIFRGRGDSSTNRPRRPYDPKQDHNWGGHNESPQRHHSAGQPNYGHGSNSRDNYYPSGYPEIHDQEFYHGGGVGGGIGGGINHGRDRYHTDSITGGGVVGVSGINGGRIGSSSSNNRRDNGWTGYIPMTNVWTTERTYYTGGYKTYDGLRWKPCYCVSNDGRNRRESRIGYLKIDDKLDLPTADIPVKQRNKNY